MRKLGWGAAAASLMAVGFIVYCKVHVVPAVPVVVTPAQEEQEPAVTAAVALLLPTGPVREGAEAIEPIVVEGPVTEPPVLPDIGGAVLPGTGVRVVALGPDQSPRPDEEPGEAKHMPYAGDGEADPASGGVAWAAQCWQMLGRLLGGPASVETPEPPASEEQAAPDLRLVPPALDYHHHEMHCPYSGRCVIPAYPVRLPERK